MTLVSNVRLFATVLSIVTLCLGASVENICRAGGSAPGAGPGLTVQADGSCAPLTATFTRWSQSDQHVDFNSTITPPQSFVSGDNKYLRIDDRISNEDVPYLGVQGSFSEPQWPAYFETWFRASSMTTKTQDVTFTAEDNSGETPNSFKIHLDVGEDSLLKSWTGSQASTAHGRLTNLPQSGSTLTINAKGVYVFIYVNNILNGGCWDYDQECSTSVALRPDGTYIPLDGGYFSAASIQKSFLQPLTTTTVDIFIARPDGSSVLPDEHLSIVSTWDFGCSEECAQQGGSCRNGVCQCGGQGYGRHCSVQSDDMCYYLVSDLDSQYGFKRYQLAPIDMDADYTGASFSDFYGVSSSKAHSGMERHESVAMAILKSNGKLALFSSIGHLNPRFASTRTIKWGWHVKEYYDILEAHGELDHGTSLSRWCSSGQSINTNDVYQMNSLWRNLVDSSKSSVLDDCYDYGDAVWWSGHDPSARSTDGFQADTSWPYQYTDGIVISDIPLPQYTPLANGSYEKVVLEMYLTPADSYTTNLLKTVFLVTYNPAGGYQWIPIPTSYLRKARFEVQKCCSEPITYEALVNPISDPGYVGKYANDKDCVSVVTPPSMVEPAFFYTHYNELDFGTGDGLSVYTTAAMDTVETCSILDTELLTTSAGTCAVNDTVEAARLNKGQKVTFDGSATMWQRFTSDSSDIAGGYNGHYAVIPLLQTSTEELELPGAESCFVLAETSSIKFKAENFDPTILGTGCRWNRDDNMVTRASAVEGEPGWFTCNLPSREMLPGAEAYSSIDMHITTGVPGGVSVDKIVVPLCSVVNFAISSLVTTENKDRFLAGVNNVQIVGRLRSASGFLLSGDIEDVTSVFNNVYLSTNLRTRLCCGPTAADRDCKDDAVASLVLPSQESFGSVFDDVTYNGFLWPGFDTSMINTSTLCTVYAAHKNPNTYGGWSGGLDLMFVGDPADTLPTSIEMSWNFTEAATAAGSTPAGICTEYGLTSPSGVCWPNLPTDNFPAVDVSIKYNDGSEASAVAAELSWECTMADGVTAVPGTFTFPAIAPVHSGRGIQIPRPTILDDVLCKLTATTNVEGNVINGETGISMLVNVQQHTPPADILYVNAEWQNGVWDASRGMLAVYAADATIRLDAIFGNGSYADQTFTELELSYSCSNGITVDTEVGVTPSDAGLGLFKTIVFPGDSVCNLTLSHPPTGLSSTTDPMAFVPVITSLTAAFRDGDVANINGTDFHTNGIVADVLVGGMLSTGDPLTTQLDDVSLFWRCKDDLSNSLTVMSGAIVVGVDGVGSLPIPSVSEYTDYYRTPLWCAATARTTRYDGSDITVMTDYVRIVPNIIETADIAYTPADLTTSEGVVYHTHGAEATVQVTNPKNVFAEANPEMLYTLSATWACRAENGTNLTATITEAGSADADGFMSIPYPTITDNPAGPVASPVFCRVKVAAEVPGGGPLFHYSDEARIVPEWYVTGTAAYDDDIIFFDGENFHHNGASAGATVSTTTLWGDATRDYSRYVADWTCTSPAVADLTVTAPINVAVLENGTVTLPYPTISNNPDGPVTNAVRCKVVFSIPNPEAAVVEFLTDELRIMPTSIADGTATLAASEIVTYGGYDFHVSPVGTVQVEGLNYFGEPASTGMETLTGLWHCRAENGTAFSHNAGETPLQSNGTLFISQPTIEDNPTGPVATPVLCKVVVTSPIAGGGTATFETVEVRVAPSAMTGFTSTITSETVAHNGHTFVTNGTHANVSVTDGVTLWNTVQADHSRQTADWACELEDGTALTTVAAPVSLGTEGAVTLPYPTITDNPAGPIDSPVFCKAVVAEHIVGSVATVEAVTGLVRIAPAAVIDGGVSFASEDLVTFGGDTYHINSGGELTVAGTLPWGAAPLDFSALTALWSCESDTAKVYFLVDAGLAMPVDGIISAVHPEVTNNVPGPIVSKELCKVTVTSPVTGGPSIVYESDVVRIVPAAPIYGTVEFAEADLVGYEGTVFHTDGAEAAVVFAGRGAWNGTLSSFSGVTAEWSCLSGDGIAFTIDGGAIDVSEPAVTLPYPTITDNPAGPIDSPVFCKAVVTSTVPRSDDVVFQSDSVRIAPPTMTSFDVAISAPKLYALETVAWEAKDGVLIYGAAFDPTQADTLTASFDCHGVVTSYVNGQDLVFPDVNADVAQDCTLTVTATHNGYVTTASATVSAVPLAEVQAAVADGKLKSRPSADPLHTDGFSLDVGATLRYSDDTDAVVSSGATVTLQCRADELAAYEDVSSLDLGTVATGSFDYPSMVDSRQCRLRASSTRLDAVYTSASFELAPAAIAEASVAITPLVDENGDGIPDEEVSNVTYAVTASLQNGTAATDAALAVTSTYTWSCCVLNTTSGGCYDDVVPEVVLTETLTTLSGIAKAPTLASTSFCELSVELFHSGNNQAPSAAGSASIALFHKVGGTSSSGMGTGSKVLLIILLIIAATLGAWYGINKYFNNRKAEGIAPPAWFTAAQGAVMTAGAYTVGAMSNVGHSVKSAFRSTPTPSSDIEMPVSVAAEPEMPEMELL